MTNRKSDGLSTYEMVECNYDKQTRLSLQSASAICGVLVDEGQR